MRLVPQGAQPGVSRLINASVSSSSAARTFTTAPRQRRALSESRTPPKATPAGRGVTADPGQLSDVPGRIAITGPFGELPGATRPRSGGARVPGSVFGSPTAALRRFRPAWTRTRARWQREQPARRCRRRWARRRDNPATNSTIWRSCGRRFRLAAALHLGLQQRALAIRRHVAAMAPKAWAISRRGGGGRINRKWSGSGRSPPAFGKQCDDPAPLRIEVESRFSRRQMKRLMSRVSFPRHQEVAAPG